LLDSLLQETVLITTMGEAEKSCFLCSDKLIDLKRLKVHMLRSHPKSHICLFCVEEKGWSTEFGNQHSYNSHYQMEHSGVIEQRAGERDEQKRLSRQQKHQDIDTRRKKRAGSRTRSDPYPLGMMRPTLGA